MKADVVPFPKHHQAWGGKIMQLRSLNAKVGQQSERVNRFQLFGIQNGG